MISKNLKIRIFTSSALLLLLLMIFSFNLILIFSLLVLSMFSLQEFFSMTQKIFKKKINYLIINFLFLFYISVFCMLFFLTTNFFELKVILFIILIGCISSDIGGYVSGKIFKGPKLTKISPNKTISGAFGSIIFTCLIMSFLFYNFTGKISFKIFIVSFFTSLFCQLGDLFFSYLKRKAKLKDTGNFLPGHGGVLDRLDGIFVGVPAGYISLIIVYNL